MLLSWKYEGQNVMKEEKGWQFFQIISFSLDWIERQLNSPLTFFLSLQPSEITSVMMEVTWQWRNSKRTKVNSKSSIHIPENKTDLLFSRLMKKTGKTWNNHAGVQTRSMCTYKLAARVRKDNESKALSLPDCNPQQEVGNFSVLLEIMPQASVKGIQWAQWC